MLLCNYEVLLHKDIYNQSKRCWRNQNWFYWYFVWNWTCTCTCIQFYSTWTSCARRRILLFLLQVFPWTHSRSALALGGQILQFLHFMESQILSVSPLVLDSLRVPLSLSGGVQTSEYFKVLASYFRVYQVKNLFLGGQPFRSLSESPNSLGLRVFKKKFRVFKKISPVPDYVF